MSKSKSAASKGAAKPEAAILKKVKDAAVTKPAQTPKVKSKEVAKQVAVKEGKKNKQKVVKEPTPELSDSDSEDSEESASSASSESEEEAPVTKPVHNGKVNGSAKAPAVAASDSEEDSEDDADSSDEVPAKGVSLKARSATAAIKDVSDSDESEDSEDESEEEKPTKNKGPIKATDLAKKLTPIAAPEGADQDSEAESEADSEDSEEDSDDSDDSEEVETKPTPATKRKAEEVATPVAKKTKTAEAEVDSSQGGNLFVGNLSWNVDEEWLTREFEEFGELTGVRLITDRETGRSKGFGYVEFADAADAAKAHAAKKGTMIDGRECNVDFAQSRSNGGPQDRAQSRAKSFGDSTSPPTDTLFVGNLSFDADEDVVSETFAEFGTIKSVRLPTDRETGQPKGFGYVTFMSVDEAKAALEGMHGAEINGRPCRLDFSQPRPANGDSPARGGRGGGRGFGDRGGRGGSRGRGGFGDRGGRGGRGRGGFGDRGGRGGRGGSTNRGGFSDFSGKKTTF